MNQMLYQEVIKVSHTIFCGPYFYVLSEVEKSLLLRSLNFSICNLQVLYAEDLDFIKTKTKDIALSSFSTYNNNVPHYLSKGIIDALKNLSQNKHFVIQKSDKGNSIA